MIYLYFPRCPLWFHILSFFHKIFDITSQSFGIYYTIFRTYIGIGLLEGMVAN